MRVVVLVSLLAACSADLPAGWEDAEPLEVVQSECKGQVLGGSQNEGIRTSLADGRVDLVYADAHFRCEQEVEAFAIREFGSVKILFQPVDLDPSSVARCDCLYDFTANVPLWGDPVQFSVFRRWDNLNGAKEPVLVGERTLDL